MPEKFSKIVHQLDWPRWAFELLIWAGLALSFGIHLFAAHRYPVLSVLSGAAFLILFYGSFIEPRLLTVKRFEIGKGERSVTIAFLSDIHVGPYKGTRWLSRVVRKVNGLSPDLVLLGGDLIYDKPAHAPLLAPLAGLKPKLGTFAILGNHEYYYGAVAATEDVLKKAGIPVLNNRWTRVGEKLVIAGTVDDWYAETDFDAAVNGAAFDDAVIMLVHNPEVATKAVGYGPALMLSGHDHGGQIRLPFIGAVVGMPHNLGKKYDRGLFRFENVPLIIGQGIGESGPRARLLCPPQIVFVTLKY